MTTRTSPKVKKAGLKFAPCPFPARWVPKRDGRLSKDLSEILRRAIGQFYDGNGEDEEDGNDSHENWDYARLASNSKGTYVCRRENPKNLVQDLRNLQGNKKSIPHTYRLPPYAKEFTREQVTFFPRNKEREMFRILVGYDTEYNPKGRKITSHYKMAKKQLTL